jgi:pimeloyl-ACP methyl ester carboxylesterase
MAKARVNDVELQYEITGSGEPVLLVGTGPIADSFLPFVSAKPLADRYTLIRYRQRRIGTAPGSPTPVSFAEHAADAASLLGHLGVGRAHVAGHSTGAAIAMQLAVDRPEAVQSLALLEPPLLGVPSAGAFFERAGAAVTAYSSGDREGAVAAFLSVASGLDWDTCRAQIEKHVPGGVAQAMKDADNFFGSYLPALGAWQFGHGRAAEISQPVLSVLGTATDPFFAESHDRLRDWFPQLEVCTIDGVAHLLHLQNPEPVARGVAEFFDRHAIGASEPADARAGSGARPFGVSRTAERESRGN